MPNSQSDVTAGAPNLESYTDNGDGTITDNVTGLIWQKAVAPGTYTRAQALAYCQTTLALANHNDWRVPSYIELVSVVDHGRSNPSINTTFFPSPSGAWFWSSSMIPGSSSQGLSIHFWYGDTYSSGLSDTINLRCVR
jgi:hypothetical protein